MGGGTYGYNVRRRINAQSYSSQVKREEIFGQRNLSPEMDIKGKVRECRNSNEHPAAFPIIIALDVTGSMGHIPDSLIRTGLPDIMQKILESGVNDPQVCFMAIGDQYTDCAPIQVGQFESSDELMDKWLKTVWLEGGGGGNRGESYQMAWYAALFHTDCDWIKIAGHKGVLITIGDEAVHKSIGINEASRIFGDIKAETELATSKLLDMANSSWDIYHINVMHYQGSQPNVWIPWKNLLKEHLINSEGHYGEDIPDIISGIILSSYRQQTSVTSPETGQEMKGKHEKPEHLL